jgi:hypothetical protein
MVGARPRGFSIALSRGNSISGAFSSRAEETGVFAGAAVGAAKVAVGTSAGVDTACSVAASAPRVDPTVIMTTNASVGRTRILFVVFSRIVS